MDEPLDKSWMEKDRRLPEYEEGVDKFLHFALLNSDGSNIVRCPCVRCVNCTCLLTGEVKNHLFMYGMDQSYRKWIWHGEELPTTTHYDNIGKEGDYCTPSNTHQIKNFPEEVEMVRAAEEHCTGDPSVFKKLVEDAEKPLYPGCTKFTKLSAVAKLYRLKASNGFSDKSFTELLELLADMLPENNELPVTVYAAKKTLKALGLDYEKIHACPNDCIPYRNEYAGATECPRCHTSRWKGDKLPTDKRDGVPAKVLWYFPPIPRFRRMFQTAQIARDLIWHDQNRKVDDQLRHPADSVSWKTVDLMWPDFGAEPRNLRLALSADGINPHSTYNTPYSCWPVILVTYNLPPWICMKRKFMMLSLLISGPKQPGINIDVYLAPLIDDLKLLWEVGVEVYDAYRKQIFTLRAVLLWTINDFPAYGNLSGCTVKGYMACPVCGPNTDSDRLEHSNKNIYTAHRRFLPPEHKLRLKRKDFNGKQEHRSQPIPLSGEKILCQVERIVHVWGDKAKKKKEKKGEAKCWNKKSIFFELEYWKHLHVHLHVRHNLDVMHIEKNVCDSIVGTLLNIPSKTKDGVNARNDWLKKVDRPELEPQVVGNRTYLSPACFSLTKEEKRSVYKTLFEVKVPEGFSSNFKNLVSMKELKVIGLKSHDCHILMQQLLPVAIRSVLPNHVRVAITRFCLFFKNICSKVVDVTILPAIQKQLVLTLCVLEKYFPPSFFDIMIHLTVHLVREVQLCGPVHFRWMYPFERYMKVLKGYVRNRYRPEGCIAECYIAEEAVEFCTDYLSGVDAIGIPVHRNMSLCDFETGRALPGGKHVRVDRTLLEQAHRYVLSNTSVVQPYVEEHMEYLRKLHPKKSKKQKWLEEEHGRTFISWIRKKVEELLGSTNQVSRTLEWIAYGPASEVIKVHGYIIKGCRYHTRDRDPLRVNQNSGVSLVARAMHVSSARDNNPVYADACYYGVITEIWLLNYHIFEVPVFKCDWVDLNNGVKVDDLGFTLVQLHRVGHKNDPFILASQARQVFYVEDQLNPVWSVVLSVPQNENFQYEMEDAAIDVCEKHMDVNQILPDDNYLNIIDPYGTSYHRDGVQGIWVDD